MKPALVTWIVLLAVAGPAVAQEIRPTFDKIKQTGTIHLGYRESSWPFSYLDKDRKPVGYSVDLCGRVVDAVRQSLKLAELKVDWVVVTPADRIAKVVNGTIDLECGSTTITFSRMEQVSFSHMIFVDGGSLLATTASGIFGVKDLAGKRVGVIPKTTTEKALADALTAASVQAQVITVSEHRDGLQGLEDGRLDAYASDRLPLSGLQAAAKNPTRLRLSNEYFSYEPYGLMLRRGDNAFQAQVNRTLSALYRSRGLVQVYERWFGPYANANPMVKALYLLHSWPD